MMALPIIALVTEALKLINAILEGIPVQQRQAQAKAWFIMWLPLTRFVLKLSGATEDQIKSIEDAAK